MQKGFARPGYFFIDRKGIIREKFFEAKYRERLTGNSMIAKLFPELGEQVTETVEAPHLQLALEQSDRTSVSRDAHYARRRSAAQGCTRLCAGAPGYKPIKLVIDPMPEMELRPAVYRNPGFSIARDQRASTRFRRDFPDRSGCKSRLRYGVCSSLGKDGKTFTDYWESGYQAYNQTKCYLPTSIPVKWQLQVFAPGSNPGPP